MSVSSLPADAAGPGGAPRLIGLLGHPLGHTRSPAMHQAALDALGIAARYEAWDTPPDALAARVAGLRAAGMLGANVTIPYKTAVLPLLDEVAAQARQVAGAVNTIVREETPQGVRLVGHNTDVVALLRILDEQQAWTRGQDDERRDDGQERGQERGQSAAPPRLLVLGAGGAAQAALGVARLRGAEAWVAARRIEAARATLHVLWQREAPMPHPPALPDEWQPRALDLTQPAALADALRQTDILVNATPVGTHDANATPVPLTALRALPPWAFVLDMVYNPPQTALVRAARARGLRAMGGVTMLLYQGAASFTLWTGHPAPLAIMRAALEASLLPDAASPAHDAG